MNLLRQLLSFGAVGALATMCHVTLAWTLIAGTSLDHYFANFLGTCAAFSVSFLGNARFTFQTDRKLLDCARRYLFVSLLSFAMTSLILFLVENWGLPTYTYVLLVIAIVPGTTFLLAKFWAFGLVRSNGLAGDYLQ